MNEDEGRRRYGPILAALLGMTAALLAILIVVLVTDDGPADTHSATSTPDTTPTSALPTTSALDPITTTAPPPTTTTPPPPTTTTPPPPTTTAAPPTTTTTTPPATSPPFGGTLDDKTCTASGPPAGMVTDIRFAQREGFTRVVFDFSGGAPGCFTTYNDPTSLHVIAWFVDASNAYAPGIFDGGGQLQLGTNSVERVSDGGPSAGSGEYEFVIGLGVPDRPYEVFTLEGPSRLVIDISD